MSEELQPPAKLLARLALADRIYADLRLPTKKAKADDGTLTAQFWGAGLRGNTGILGTPLSKRADLAAITMSALARGASGDVRAQLVSSWACHVYFRRELLSILQASYRFAEAVRETGSHVVPDGETLDELLCMCLLFPLMQTYLSDLPPGTPEASEIYATDACGSGGLGGCRASLPFARWLEHYSFA